MNKDVNIKQPGPAEYLKIGFKAIKLRGYNNRANPSGYYKTAKQSVTKKFTASDYSGMSLSEIEEAKKQGHWIGWLVPEGYIVIDSENQAVIAVLDAMAKNDGCSVQKTRHGKQYLFYCDEKSIPASSEYFCEGGFPVTPRVAGKNYVIMPDTDDRYWEQWTEAEKLPHLPDILLPHDSGNQEQITLCLAWTVGEAYREGNLAGWEDIDAAFMAYLFERDFDIEFIHKCFNHVFTEKYDRKRTDDMYGRIKGLKLNGKKALGSGSFIKKIKDLKIEKIRSFIGHVNTNRNKASEESGEKNSNASLAQRLIEIAEQYLLFHDDRKDAYAWIKNETYSITGTAFRQLVAHELYKKTGKAAGTEAIKQALTVIEAKAVFDGQMIELHNRVAAHDGAFYCDMGNGRVVKITAAGWEISNLPPILFRLYSHQLPQVAPERGGNLDRIFDFINVASDQDQLLIEVILVSFFIPIIAHPILFAQGGQGTGKTKALSFIKQIIDPSKIGVFIPPHDKRELIQILDHHYFCVFDNLSYIPEWFSDILSTAVTGGGQSKRKLYSDNEDVIFTFKRCIALTSINMCIDKSDLLDRTITIHFDRIPPTHRKEEVKMVEQFGQEKPRLLGAIFDTLSMAMKIYPTIKTHYLPRMADFYRWGCAIAVALGYKMDDFINAYNVNIQNQHQEIIHGNTLAKAILIFMEDKTEWIGFVGELYEKLKKIVVIEKEDKTFPSYSNKLRSHIERIEPNLLQYGIKVSIANNPGMNGTAVTIKKVTKIINENGCSCSSEIENNIPTRHMIKTEDHEDDSLDVHDDPHSVTIRNNNEKAIDEDYEDRNIKKEDPLCVCYACGGHEYWRGTSGAKWNCFYCHPPAAEHIIAERRTV